MKYANFFIFWMLLTWAFSLGDPIAMLLAIAGFLFMHTMIEDLFDETT